MTTASAPPRDSTARSVLLLGNYRPALTVARALSAAGYHVIAGWEGDEGGCEASRFVDEMWDHPRLVESEGAFLDALSRLLDRRNDIAVVFPIAEEFVHLFARNDWRPPANVVVIGPSAELVLAFSDKPRTLTRARDLGVPTLPFERVTGYDGLLAAAKRIGFPLTVRPLGTTARLGSRKAVIAACDSDLERALPDWPAGHRELLLQRFAVGQRHNIYFAAERGALVGLAASRIIRTNHHEGTGLAVAGQTERPSPELVADTAALIADCDYTGIGLAQFIVDPHSGERCFLELNPRVSGSHAVPERAGLPLSTMAVDLAFADRPAAPGAPVIGRSGLRYVWMTGEIIAIKKACRRGEIGVASAIAQIAKAAAGALRADIHMVWSWNDPWPALRTLWSLVPAARRWRDLLAGQMPDQGRKIEGTR